MGMSLHCGLTKRGIATKGLECTRPSFLATYICDALSKGFELESLDAGLMLLLQLAAFAA
jgi:hypothetical protein